VVNISVENLKQKLGKEDKITIRGVYCHKV